MDLGNAQALFIKNPLLARDRLEEIGNGHGGIVERIRTVQTGQGEPERKSRVPSHSERIILVMPFVSSLEENPRKNANSRIHAERRAPLCLLVVFAFKTPDPHARVKPGALQCETQTKVSALQRLFLVIRASLLPLVEGMVVVQRHLESLALQIKTRANPPVFVFGIVIVKDRASRNNVVRQTGAIHNPQIAVKALLLLKPRPEHQAGLQKQCVSGPAMFVLRQQKRNDGIQIARDILTPNPADARIQAEVLVKQRNASRPDGILNRVDQYARTCVAEGAFAALRVIARSSRRNGGAVCAVRAVEAVSDGERTAAVGASQHAAPQPLNLRLRSHKQGVLRPRRRRRSRKSRQ